MADKKVIMDLEINVGDSLEQLTKINKELIQLQKEKKELDKAIKDGTATDEMVAHYSEVEAAIKTLTRARGAEMREIYQEAQQYRYAADTVQGMSDRLRQMKDEYVKMSAEMRNSPMGKQLAQDIRETTTAIAVMKDEMQPSFIEKFNQKIISVTASFNRFPKTLSGLKASLATVTSAFKVLFRTIIMNPIGLLITAITGLVVIFAKFFKETEAGQRIMKVFGDATKGLVDILVGFVNIVATAVEWVLKLIPAYRQAADAAESAARSQEVYNEVFTALTEKEQKLVKQRSLNADKIEELNAKINDSDQYSLEQRSKFIEQKRKLLQKDRDDTAKWAVQMERTYEAYQKDVKNLTGEAKENAEKFIEENAEAYKKAQDILASGSHTQWEIDQQIKADNKKIEDEVKARNDKIQQENNKILQETQRLQQELSALWREIYLDARNKEIEALDDTYQHNVDLIEKTVKDEVEKNKLLLDLTNKYRQDVAAINKKYDDEEAAKKKAERVKELTSEETLRQLQAREATLKQMELDNQALFNARQNEVEQTQVALEQSQRRIEIAQQEADRIKNLTQEQVEVQYGEGEEGLQKWKNAQIEANNAVQDATRASILAQEDFTRALQESQLETIANFQTILQGMSSLTGAFQSLFSTLSEDDAEMQKYTNALSYINIMVNMAEGIAGAIAQAQSVPFPANIAAMATGVAAVVTGIGEALSIYKKSKSVPTPPKFSEGGLVGDQTSTRTDDSVNAKLSVGEYVVRSSVVKAMGVDFFNQLNGTEGKPHTLRFAQGGIVPSITTMSKVDSMNYDLMRDMFMEVVENIHPEVSVSEINRVNNYVTVKENISKY